MDLQNDNTQFVKQEPLDEKNEFIYPHIDHELEINADIVTYLNVTLDNQSDEEELYNSDLDENQCSCQNHHPFTCEICKKSFRTYRSLQVHSSIHVKTEFENMSTCTICHKKFEPRKLTYHFRSHNLTKSYKCYYCTSSYYTQNHLDEHILNCHTDYLCNKCDIRFQKESDLKDHYKSHSEDLLYACSICDQTFSTIQNLSKHVTTHNKKRKTRFCD